MAVYPSFFYRILLRRYRLPWLATPKKEGYAAIDYIAAPVQIIKRELLVSLEQVFPVKFE